jgi:alpha-L-rhamnosidase
MKLSRRGLLSAAAMTPVVATLPAMAASSLTIKTLQSNALPNPMGIDDQAVRLSWQLVSDQRDTLQTRYRITVASSAEALKAGHYDLWDSGEIASDQSLDITYNGKPLPSRAQAFWQVTVWDNHGGKAQSPVATWEMALLNPADWTAQWIAAEDADQRADRETGLIWVSGGRAPDKTHRLFRLTFTLPETAETTVLSIANNTYDLYIDGKLITLPPTGEPRFGKAELVETSVKLTAGKHVIAVKVRDPDGFLEMYQPEIATALMIRAGDRRISSAGTRTALGEPANWTSASFDDSHWDIAGKAAYQMEAFPGKGAFLLRKTFAAKTVTSARLYASALGGYETWINGARVGDALLTPESTDFRDHTLYRVYDVTQMIRNGHNAIGAMVGDGWYGSYNAPAGRFAYGPPPLRYIAQLELTYAEGSRATIVTDESWLIRPAPVVSSEIYNGETYDARLETAGWSEPGDSAGWLPVHLAPVPPCALKAHSAPPIRRTKTLTAISIKKMSNGAYVYDFGQNFAGWIKLKVRGKSGDTVTLRFAEVLLADGRVDQSNLRAAKATDVYILKGDAKGETYEPHFTYHGFRYVEVSGFPGVPTVADITGIVVNSDLPEIGHLRIGNPIIQQLWQNALWSQRSNFVGIPTDCPQRDERLGWMGDAGVFWDAASFNMNVTAFTQRFMQDVRDAQSPEGAFPDFAPNTWDDAWGAYGASAGWADAGVILPWTVWKKFGDTAIIDQNWQAMTAYLAFLKSNNPDFIWNNKRGHDYADWLALDAKEPGDPTTPKDIVATALWKQSADMMADMAKATGRAADYAEMSASIRAAFIKAFVRPDGSLGNGSQTGYILALKYDLVPTELRNATAAHLVADIKRRGMLLSTGFLGTPASLDVLSNAGYDEIVYNLLLRTTFPSWGYMVAKDATTIWERWNADTGDVSMNSFNHYALGAVNGFVFRRIAGINPATPGFKTFIFDPVLDPRVKTGGGDYDSVLGRISTDWAQTTQGFTLDITVPANARAIVILPGAQISEGGKPIKALSEGERSRVEIGSGRYRFLSR